MGGFEIVDVSNGSNLKRQNWVTTAPAWRQTRHGLCLEGVCNNTTCVANGQRVIMPIGYARFDLGIQQITTDVSPSLISAASNVSTTTPTSA